jgi:hypothetical protein
MDKKQSEDTYLQIARQLPRPTEEQIERFAVFVSTAHSWYKHLPLVPPGVPFLFYLDPNAGRSILSTPTGDTAYVDITDESPRFHYTWQTTVTYHTQFGFLQYNSDYGPSLQLIDKHGVLHLDGPGPKILTLDGDWIEVPSFLLTIGKVELTAMVHSHGNPIIWLNWPEQSGLSQFPEKEREAIVHHYVSIAEQERKRQLDAMRQSMTDFVKAVYDA